MKEKERERERERKIFLYTDVLEQMALKHWFFKYGLVCALLIREYNVHCIDKKNTRNSKKRSTLHAFTRIAQQYNCRMMMLMTSYQMYFCSQ